MKDKICEWCTHEWHEGECWCYCLEATDYPEPEICDKCGIFLLEDGMVFVIFPESPVELEAVDGVTIDKGDVLTLCWDCHCGIMGEEQRDYE